MDVLRTVTEWEAWRARVAGPVVWVPTMGALHTGHLAHVGVGRGWLEEARGDVAGRDTGTEVPVPGEGVGEVEGGAVVVSVFVNPTQFGPGEDLARYPRTLEVDLARCEAAGASAVFAPEVETMYPVGEAGPAGAVELAVPGLTDVLEGRERPGHFAGVCRIVVKFLNLIRPDAVTFGQKDYQQLCVVRAVIEDLMMRVAVLEVPTVREDDGLAMSSRNRNLNPTTRRHGLGLVKALRQARQMVVDGEVDPAALESAMRHTMQAHHVAVDYAAVRRVRTLAAVDVVVEGECVALVAGRVGAGVEGEGEGGGVVRLIDNLELG